MRMNNQLFQNVLMMNPYSVLYLGMVEKMFFLYLKYFSALFFVNNKSDGNLVYKIALDDLIG